jgi:hypothetical protein
MTALIATSVSTLVRVQPDGPEADAMLVPGLYDAQSVTILNVATNPSSTLSFADEPTSHVARGTGSVLYPGTQATFVWDAQQQLWYGPANHPAPAPLPPDPEPPPAGALVAKPAYASVELSWDAVPGASMYRLSRREPGGSYTVVDTLPGTHYLDTTVRGGQAYEYVVAAKTPGLGPDSAPTSVTPHADVPPETPMSELNAAIADAAPGSTVDLAPGVYRIPRSGLPTFNKPLTLRSANRDVWLLCSRDWGLGREAANTWTQVGSYWRSSRPAPVLQPNPEDTAQVSDWTLAGFYNNVTAWKADGTSQWLRPIAAGGTPQGAQVCYESDSDRRLRIGLNPVDWQRIEVTEALSWGSAQSSDLTFEGITFRGAGGGSADASFDLRGRQNITFRDCVMGNTHSGGLTMWQGETNTRANILIERCWFDRCGYGPLSASSINGVTVRDCLFTSTGGQGYNEIWHGGDFKFVGNAVGILIEYCISYDATGASWWADISAADYEVRYCKAAHNKRFYAFSHEISLRGNVHHNLFWDGGLGTGYPTAHTDQGSGLDFHDNTVVGADGSISADDGKVFQFQGAQSDGTYRPDAPAGGCFDNRIHDNWFIHLGADCFTWSMQAHDGKFAFSGNRWWSANPYWKYDAYNNAIGDIETWNSLPDVDHDIFASVADKDRQLRYWGIIPDERAQR